MKYEYSLSEIYAMILTQSEMEASTFISESELLGWINFGLQELYDLLIYTFTDEMCVIGAIKIDAGQQIAKLPKDFYKLVYMGRVVSETKVVEMRPAPLRDLLRGMHTIDDYAMWSNGLYFGDTADAETNLFLVYIPRLGLYMNLDDQIGFNVPWNWLEFVVADGIIRALSKEESDATYWVQRKEQLRQQIKEMAESRQMQNFEGLQDHYQVEDDWGYYANEAYNSDDTV